MNWVRMCSQLICSLEKRNEEVESSGLFSFCWWEGLFDYCVKIKSLLNMNF